MSSEVDELADGAFTPPCVTADAVIRASVVSNLAAGPGRVATVVAPAGYGKTTQVAAWARSSDLRVAWVDLEVACNDPVILLPLLIDALRSVTDLDATDLLTVHPTPTQVATVVAPRLGQAVGRCTVPFGLVLDDAHTAQSRAAVDLIDAVVANMPEGCRVVVCGRAVCLPSIARLRAGVGLTEAVDTDLALGPGDARRLLSAMGVVLDDRQLAAVVADTEGWPVGLRLAGLAHLADQDRDTGRETLEPVRLTGRERAVGEYLRSEWLRTLGPEDRRFLRLVSGIEWLHGSICDDVLETVGSGAVLERIHANQRLVIPLDRQHDSYRMHGLLRSALEAEAERTAPDEVRRVHQRASEWYERHGESELAVRHAFRAGDLARSERLVAEFAPMCQTRGMTSTFERWLSAFPAEHVYSTPSLSLLAAMVFLGRDSAAVQAWTSLCRRTLDNGATSAQDPFVGLKFLAFQAAVWNGPAQPALDFSAEAYRGLPPGVWHVLACEAYGAHALALGQLDLAAELLAEGAREARLFGARTLELICDAHLAVARRRSGDTAQAAMLALDVRRRMSDYGLEQYPTLIVASAMAAWAAARNGQAEVARRDILAARRSLALMDGICAWATVQARLAAAEASLLLGDRVGAGTLLKEAESSLVNQPDAVTPRRQWAELEQQVAATRQVLPVGPSSLSAAELRVLAYLPTNLTIAEIGERLYVSRHTTKSHVATIYRKLGTSSRQETVEACRARRVAAVRRLIRQRSGRQRSGRQDLRLLRVELRVGEDARLLQLAELLERGQSIDGWRRSGHRRRRRWWRRVDGLLFVLRLGRRCVGGPTVRLPTGHAVGHGGGGAGDDGRARHSSE